MRVSSSFASERGSGPIDFVLLGLPMLAVGVVCAVIFGNAYQKDVLLDAAVEAANYASLADQDIGAAETRVRRIIDIALPGSQPNVEVSSTKHGSLKAVQVAISNDQNFWFTKSLSAKAIAVNEIN